MFGLRRTPPTAALIHRSLRISPGTQFASKNRVRRPIRGRRRPRRGPSTPLAPQASEALAWPLDYQISAEYAVRWKQETQPARGGPGQLPLKPCSLTVLGWSGRTTIVMMCWMLQVTIDGRRSRSVMATTASRRVAGQGPWRSPPRARARASAGHPRGSTRSGIDARQRSPAVLSP